MLYPRFSNATVRPGAARRLLWLLVGAFFLAAPLEAQTQQLRSNTNDEGWGPRQSNTSGGKLLWFEHDGVMNKDDVYFYNGTSASLVQAQGTLTGIGDIVFALGTGASAGHVIGAWRRETDFAWISVDGGTPVLVSATNPSNPAAPLNPEGAGIADGCVFLILQDATGAFPRKYVYKANPATGAATILTDPATFPVTGAADGAPRITTSGCKAAWRYFDGSGVIKLHFYDGASIQVIDSGDIDLPHMSGGRVVYAKTVAGVSQVFLYDSNLPSPSPVPLTSYSDPTIVNSFAKTDGRHVAWLRQNALDNSNRQIVLNGGVQLTTGANKPDDGSVFGDFPLQLQRGQLLWKDATGNLRYARNGAITSVAISPATSVSKPWLADGYVSFLGLSNDGGTDIEPFRFTGTAPSDAVQPSAPFLLSASPGDTQVPLKWDRILGVDSYNVYYARSPGVTKDNYLTLPGGTKIAGVTSPYTVTGLPNGMAHYFVVTSVEGATEGPNSAEASATPRAPSCVRSSGGGCFTTVQAALSGASAGDVIRVAEGTYVGAPAGSGSNGNFLIDKTLTLEGGWNSTFTSRDPVARVTTLTPGNANFSVVDIEGQIGNPDAVAPTMDGFTITGALGGNHGGGIRIRDSNAVIRNCIVIGNRAYLLGGGIWVQRGAPRLENNRIESNGIVPGGGSGGGVELEGTQATLIGNTIVTNTIQDVSGSGGGVSVDGGGLVRLTNNTITNNAAATKVGVAADKAFGGGVSINGATVALTGNLISFNSANSVFAFGFGGGFGSGGGLYIFNSASFTLTGNTISNNTGGYAYYVYLTGGGALVDSSQGQLLNDVISDNRANGNILFGNGAGIAATSSTLKINGAQILNNKTAINCEGYGGGLYAKSSTITMDATVVQNNCAANTPFYGAGGGLAFIDSPFTVTNSLIAKNFSYPNDTAVGGIFAGLAKTGDTGCGVGTTANNSPGVLVNVTVADNKGQGINTGSTLTLANSIIMDQTTGVKLCAAPTVTAKYNDFYNNSVANASGFTLDSTNIVINPQLTAGYSPMRGSPVIDAGDNTRVPAGITTDLAGAPRFMDDPTKPDTGVGPAPIVDIGAYEFQPGLGFYTVAPCRVIDTRNSNGPLGGPSLAAGTTRTFALTGQCGIPSGAKAVSVNVAVTAPTGLGHLRMYPADQALPLISVINFNAGQTRGNNAILPLSASGDLAVFCGLGGGTVELILDVNGYFQ